MTVLIAFATVEGQTGKIARFVEGEVGKSGVDSVLLDLSGDGGGVSFAGIDRVILAAPVHERRHPQVFERFLSARREDLAGRPTLLISVSLSAAFADGLEEAQDYVVEMKMRTGFEPDREVLVAGAVRGDSYDYFQREVVRYVVLRNRDYDPKDSEHEFTDWKALSRTISDFLSPAA